MIIFKEIDPVAIYIGSFGIYWYAISYLIGILFALFISVRINKRVNVLPEALFDDLLTYSILGILIGGRLGHVLFYDYAYYFMHPLEILYLRQGGMSFHGGLIGMLIASYALHRKHNADYKAMLDIFAVVAGFGIMLGRIANFINQELYGRVTEVPWGILYKDGSIRHPSQIYEAISEGLLISIVMFVMLKRGIKIGSLWYSNIFLLLYSLARFICEYFREPESDYILFTHGQWLSLPMFMFALCWIVKKGYSKC